MPSSSLGKQSSGAMADTLFKAHQKKIKAMHPELTDIKKENSFKVTEAGVRIVLQNPVNIREFVNSINKYYL